MESLSNLVNSLKTKDDTPIDIPYEGSLPLLALGDIGVLLWREKKRQIVEKYQKTNKDGQ